MHGDPTDNNATLFAQGYNGVLNPLFASKKYTLVTQDRRHVGSADGADRVPAGLHGS